MGYNGASTVVQGNSIIFLTQLYQGKQAQAKWMTLHVCKFLLSLTTNEDPANLVQWCLEMWHYLQGVQTRSAPNKTLIRPSKMHFQVIKMVSVHS